VTSGAADFEPKGDNPMIGFRGASRYFDEGLRLECAALRRVRDDMGLYDVIVMVPFCGEAPSNYSDLAAWLAAGAALIREREHGTLEGTP